MREHIKRFRVTRQASSQDRFVNEIDAELGGMPSRRVDHVVVELILLLIASDRKSGDGGDKLIVAKRFEAGGGVKVGAKGKGQCQAKARVPVFGVMKSAGLEGERSQPVGLGLILLIDEKTEIVGSRESPSGRQCRLLDQIVVRVVAVEGSAKEPLRVRRLVPVDSSREQRIPKRGQNGRWHVNRADVGNQPVCCELRKSAKFHEAVIAVSDAGVLMDVFK